MQEICFVLAGVLTPFIGTALGAAAVFFMQKRRADGLESLPYGFAAGVMLASLVWSLLMPALESARSPLPVCLGFVAGMGFFLLCDALLPPAGQRLFFAVTLHNLPEGMAVGVALASALAGSLDFGSALVLAFGIALQNLPEGAIISMPKVAEGSSRTRGFGSGVLSGVVEPIGALCALVITSLIRSLLPWVLSFAAGAMLYVVCDELIPAVCNSKKRKGGLLALGLGFCLMMLLDVLFS